MSETDTPRQTDTLAEAQQWCASFATKHRENFDVASKLLLGDELRHAYFALYAFARGADDRADEQLESGDGASAANRALDEWQRELNSVYDENSAPSHPAFVALQDVVERHHIERELFQRMIDAFRQDQFIKRYETWSDLREYTAGSADPVGRWVLRVHGYRSPAMDAWSDAICTGLQLVNFLQDVREDFEKRDRVYLPKKDMRRFGVEEAMFSVSPTIEPVRELLRYEAKRAEYLFATGRELLDNVDPKLRKQLILFHGGGRLALHALRKADYDVCSRHISASRMSRAALLVRAVRGKPL
ncbi:squalene synthase HpnC [bacterium]|nr:squalene synthase HpnC [bacterium]